LKGSAEAILSHAAFGLSADGSATPIDREAALHVASDLASRGLRVLVLAYIDWRGSKTTLTHADVERRLTFVGFPAMIDPPGAEAIAAVRACQSAGIDVKMIPGDHCGTAVGIARADWAAGQCH
jgi:Ca2+-transporting ATPase